MSIEGECNCETYAALQDWIESKPTGRLSAILPDSLYRFFFGPRPPDSNQVASRRKQVSQSFQEIVYKYRSLCEGLSVAQEARPSDPSSNQALSTEFENLLPNSSSLEITKATKDELQTHQLTLDSKANRIEKLRDNILSLLEGNERVFLRADEQEQLRVAHQILKAYSRKLNNRQKQIREVWIDRQIDRWISRLETVETKMEPYLSYEKRELEKGLKESLTQIQNEIALIEQDIDPSFLSDDQAAEVDRIKRRIRELSDHLQNYQRDYLDHVFTDRAEDIEEELSNLQNALASAKTQGQPIEHESELRNRLSETRGKIVNLQKEPFRDQLTQSHSSTLDSLKSMADTIESYINLKTKFDSGINSVESDVLLMKNTASPYLNYEEYLTRPSQSQLEVMIETTSSTIRSFREEIDFDRLSSPDQNRFSEAVQRVSEVEECLEGYNEAFVSLERDRYGDLFSGIGSNDLDLTLEQQRAVIRNDIYNQVIAAAGTGKTLTLTTRIAYLIASQDIDPSDILVITYTNEACDEMEERLAEHFGITEVQLETVHAFGNSIIQSANSRDVDPIDGNQVRNLIDRFVRTARSENDDRFLSHYYEFLVHFEDVYLDEADFETKEEYVQARSEQRYQTLQGEEVKSRAEKQIADFLFTHQVEYRYEDIATWAETSAEKSSYEPDFYLPEYDIYIEHLGIDLAGEIAPWFSWSTEEYHDKVRWAREQFAATDSELVETYEFEHEAGRLDQSLRARLDHHNVNLNRMGFEALVESAFDYNQREGWIKRKFADFIQNAKRFDVKPDRIENQLNPDNPRQFHFGHCGILLLQRYQQFLVENDLIDFSDMINQSLELIQANPDPYQSRYEHVLVDEFQDIGKGKLELIREFVGSESAHLFAVGDDWQSIYSFQGAVVDYFIDFDDHFGTPTRTTLTDNFRSPPQVIDAGNALIETNDEQIKKEVNPTVNHDTTPLVHGLQGYSFHDYAHRVSQYGATLVKEYLQRGAAPDDIMVLCRFDGAVPYLDEVKSILRESGIPYNGKSDEYHGKNGDVDSGVSVYSVYQAKGREAEHVILLHAAEGPFGFPPAGRENELLEPVKQVGGNTVAEERRAFYVAITRTEGTLDILTRNGQESRFLSEIEAFTETVDQSESIEPLDKVGSEMIISAKVNHLFDDTHEKKHQEGYLEDQYGGSARFVSWESTNPPTLVKGHWYRFKRVKVDQFNDRKELVIKPNSTIEQLESPQIHSSSTESQPPTVVDHIASESEHPVKPNQNSSTVSPDSKPANQNDKTRNTPCLECDSHQYWHFVAISDLGYEPPNDSPEERSTYRE